MKRQILIGNDPGLRKQAVEVQAKDVLSSQTQKNIDDLLDTLEAADGLGLAAPQIGINQRIVIVVQGNQRMCLVNPIVTTHSKERALGEEGCFSFPGLYGKVARYTKVSVDALDRRGKALHFEAHDLDARVIQHELDHLNGVLLPDRLKEKEAAPTVIFEGQRL
ncbi:MAG: peptide deformylase [Parcubacteria group bacterium]